MTGNGKWQLGREKYLTPEQVKRLTDYCTKASEFDSSRNRRNMVVAAMVIDLGLHAGLRVAEIADLWVGDCRVGYGESSVIVRRGKGGKRGEIIIGKGLKKRLKSFLASKRKWGENLTDDAHLLLSQRNGPYTTRGLQMTFKRVAKKAGLPSFFSIHCLRHTLAVNLLRATKNLRLCQKALRHSSVATTTVYADCLSQMTGWN